MKATIVLVHGAFAESSSWNDVIDILRAQGHPVIAAANPLRGVASDAAMVTSLVRAVTGPVVLVGHSYGGAGVSNVPGPPRDIPAPVYVAGFAPDSGERAADLSGRVPGSTLAEPLELVDLDGLGRDMYIDQGKYHQQFCADLPQEEAAQMAVTQRPCTEAALNEGSGPAP